MTFPVTPAVDDRHERSPGGTHERCRTKSDGRKAVSRQDLPVPVRARRGHDVRRRPTPSDQSRRMGRLPSLQRRRDRRGTEAVKARAIITWQPSQIAVTAVVTVPVEKRGSGTAAVRLAGVLPARRGGGPPPRESDHVCFMFGPVVKGGRIEIGAVWPDERGRRSAPGFLPVNVGIWMRRALAREVAIGFHPSSPS